MNGVYRFYNPENNENGLVRLTSQTVVYRNRMYGRAGEHVGNLTFLLELVSGALELDTLRIDHYRVLYPILPRRSVRILVYFIQQDIGRAHTVFEGEIWKNTDSSSWLQAYRNTPVGVSE